MSIRVWFENDAIQMDELGPFPARSLFTILDGNRIHVLTLPGERLMQRYYNEYNRKDGTGFASAAEAQSYLDGEFARAPIGTSDSDIAAVVDARLADTPDFTLLFDSAAT